MQHKQHRALNSGNRYQAYFCSSISKRSISLARTAPYLYVPVDIVLFVLGRCPLHSTCACSYCPDNIPKTRAILVHKPCIGSAFILNLLRRPTHSIRAICVKNSVTISLWYVGVIAHFPSSLLTRVSSK